MRSALRDVPAGEAIEPAAYEPPPAPSGNAVARFAERVSDYRATVREADGLAETIAQVCDEHGARRIAVPDGILPAGLDRLEPGIELVGDDPPLTPAQLDGLDGVLTGCAVAIAETGTIVLDGGDGQGRRALSLVPDYHLVVVTAAQVVATVPEGLARLDPASPQTWISGPSATSDIELDRVEGVHGPRTLEVILCS